MKVAPKLILTDRKAHGLYPATNNALTVIAARQTFYSTHLNHMLLYTFRITATQNTQQFIIRYEEESREGVTLRVKIVIQ